MTVEQIAKVAHEMNRAYCQSIGDNSQPTWEDAPHWQKSSAIAGVKMHINNPNATPEDSHKSWLKQKEEEGWKYGPVKNGETKEHPCFVPYNELPESQRAKDYIFRQTVHSLVAYCTTKTESSGIQSGPIVSYGKKAVGYSFNPSGDDAVAKCKEGYAALIDQMNDLRASSTSQEQKRLASVAITEAQGAQMWGVKALTWRD